jgi:spore coat polysaccharide biosynthesis protein SpsF
MSKKKVVCIIQARMASSRLPGKILKGLGHQPVLAWMVNRARRAKLVDDVVIATTTDPDDDAVATFGEQNGVPFYRGSMHDVLDRYYQAAKLQSADVIVRLTGDCPFIDSHMLDENIHTFLESDPPLDFAANRLPMDRTVPIGLDTEICTFLALETAWKETKEPHHREHVMPYFYEHPERFNILHIKHKPDYGHLRWTVDTPEDLEFLQKIAAHFSGRDDFNWLDVLEYVEAHPELSAINAQVRHKDYREVDERR